MSESLTDHSARLQQLLYASPIPRGLRAVVARGATGVVREELRFDGELGASRCCRLTPVGVDAFGFLIVRQNGRLERVPFSGTIDTIHAAMEGSLAHLFEGT